LVLVSDVKNLSRWKMIPQAGLRFACSDFNAPRRVRFAIGESVFFVRTPAAPRSAKNVAKLLGILTKKAVVRMIAMRTTVATTTVIRTVTQQAATVVGVEAALEVAVAGEDAEVTIDNFLRIRGKLPPPRPG
jgi:hypothetical protein